MFSPDPARFYLNARFAAIFDGRAYVASSDRYLSAIAGSEGFIVRHCPFFLTGVAEPAIIPVNGTTTLRAITSGGSPDYKFEWDTNDFNIFKAGSTVAHQYTRPGTYTVTVTGTDAQGSVSTTSFTVRVVTPKPRAEVSRK